MAERLDMVIEPGLGRRAGFAMVWGQAGKVLEIVLTTAIAVIAVRALKPQGFGLYSLLTNLAGTASVMIPVVTVESLGAVLPRFANARARLYLFAAVALVRLVVIVVVSAVMVSLWSVVRADLGLGPVPVKVLVAAAGYWIAQDLSASVAAYYQASLDFRRVTLWRTAGNIVTLAGLSAIVVLDFVSVGSTLVIVTAGYLTGLVGLALGLRAMGRPQRPERDELRFVFAFTRNVWLIGVATLAVSTQMYVVLIGAITENSTEVAFYAAAVAVVGRAQILLLTGWSSVIVPAFGAVHHRDGLVGLARAWRLFSRLWLLVAAPLSALLLVLATPLVDLLFGDAYEPAAKLLAIVAAFGLAGAFLAGPPSIGALWALDRQNVLARIRLLSTPFAFALAAVLISRYEAVGAVVAIGIATTATSAAELIVARRAIRFAYPVAFALWAAAASVVVALPAVLMHPHGGVQLALSASLGIGAGIAAAAVIRPFGPDDVDALRSVSPRLAASALRRFARA